MAAMEPDFFSPQLVSADDELFHANFTVNTYLGKYWRNYTKVVFMYSFLFDIVHPDRWLK